MRSIQVPTIYPSQFLFSSLSSSVASSLPVRTNTFLGMSNAANYILGQGQTLLPLNTQDLVRLTDGKKYQTAIWFNPKRQGLDRKWTVSFFQDTNPVLSRSAGGTLLLGVGLVEQSQVTQSIAPGFSQVDVHETVTGSLTVPSGGLQSSVFFTYNPQSGSTAGCFYSGLYCAEVPRPFLQGPSASVTNKDWGSNPQFYQAGQNIWTNGDTDGPLGLAMSVSASKYTLRKAGLFFWGVPYAEDGVITTKFAYAFSGSTAQMPFAGIPIPIAVRHLNGDITTHYSGSSTSPDGAVNIMLYGWTTQKNFTGSIAFNDASGFANSVSIQVKNDALFNAPQWLSCTIYPRQEWVAGNSTNGYGLHDTNYMFITGSRTGGSGNFVVSSWFFGEQGNPDASF